MTEEEAAAKLCVLLNEIEEAGYEIYASTDECTIWVGSQEILAPPCEGEPWELILK